MLAQIEKGSANPSIGILGRIISGLRIDLNDLTGPPAAGHHPHPHRGHRPDQGSARAIHGAHLLPLPGEPPGGNLSHRTGAEWRLCGGSHGERTREYLAVQSGTLRLELESGSHVIQSGEIFRFESSQEHRYCSVGAGPCSVLCYFLEYQRDV